MQRPPTGQVLPVPASQPRLLAHHDLGCAGGSAKSFVGKHLRWGLVGPGDSQRSQQKSFSDSSVQISDMISLFSDSRSDSCAIRHRQKTFGSGRAGEGSIVFDPANFLFNPFLCKVPVFGRGQSHSRQYQVWCDPCIQNPRTLMNCACGGSSLKNWLIFQVSNPLKITPSLQTIDYRQCQSKKRPR